MEVLNSVINNINEELFKEFTSSEDKEDYRFKSIMDNIAYLNLPKNDIEVLQKYKDLIKDKYKIQEHNKVIRALRSNDVIQDRLDVAKRGAYDVKVMYNDIHKIKILRRLERNYNIGFMNPACKLKGEVAMDDSEYKLIKHLFRTEREKPTNYADLMKLYVSMLKHITSKDIVKSKQLTTNKDRHVLEYSLNEKFILDHLEIHRFNNSKMKGFDTHVRERFNIECSEDDYFLD
jgi:hypothetical protein